MEKTIITTDSAPAAIGPYSQAVKAGPMVFFSGQIPLRADGSLVDGDIAVQTEQVMKNLGAVLSAAGLDYAAVVKTTIYLTDLADFSVVNDIYGEYFKHAPPARACVQVSALPKGVDIEIEGIACCE
ncbi:MAG: RidA family protein [Desulfuromonadales bacterium]|nr:RidA family protein [Desulfuromonadales bacterium]MDT8422979.1 RidA family protein [Desulfuromonadales bacterium]